MLSDDNQIREAAIRLAVERICVHARRELGSLISDHDGVDEMDALLVAFSALITGTTRRIIRSTPPDRRDAMAATVLSFAITRLAETITPDVRKLVRNCPEFTALAVAVRDLMTDGVRSAAKTIREAERREADSPRE